MSVNPETNSGHSAKTLFKFTLAANVPQKRVEWHLPAKVRLKKSHFGKPPLTECALRPPPCQSELAEAPTTFYGPPASRQYTMIFFVPVRGVSFAASDKSLPRSRKTPFDLGCSRDTSRGCVGRRCTVLSYTFRSHPYQNTVERGWFSKVFFGLRNNDADLQRASNTP